MLDSAQRYRPVDLPPDAEIDGGLTGVAVLNKLSGGVYRPHRLGLGSSGQHVQAQGFDPPGHTLVRRSRRSRRRLCQLWLPDTAKSATADSVISPAPSLVGACRVMFSLDPMGPTVTATLTAT